ncbi:hypothetical protein HMPREF9623_02052 [Stomatobaculum longum]|uniref:Uncharacterized protein n=1 Tax=Stomatobaculum longum TaxID=796942 RepID=A0AA37DFH5_9FIRM|nr:hypothetical protein [Stomatobaculum longum]EHO15731.1 hypothetical protein HMPREF9623_02052 [Stomatobaculum longum]
MANEEARNPNQPTPEEKKPGNVFLFYVIPFLLLNLLIFFLVTLRPKFKLHIEESVDFRSAEIELEMHPRLPLAAFDVKLDDTPLNLENLGGGHYKTSVDKNGTLEVTIRYINGMSRTQYEHIGSIDDQPPLISGEELDGNMLTVSFDDAQSGVDYDSIYGIDANEERVLPRSIDDAAHTAVFQITTDRLEIHASDKLGHEAVCNFSELDAMGNGGDNSHEYHTYGADEKKQGGTAVEDETLESERKRNSGKAEQSEGQTRATKESTSAARTSTAASTKAKESQTAAKTSTAAPTKAKESQTAAKTSTAAPTKAKESSAAKQTSAADTKAKETSASAGTKAKESSTAAKQTSAAGTKAKESSTAAKSGNKANAVNNSGAPAPGETVSGGKSGPEKSTEPKKSTSSIQVVEPLNP